MAFWDTWFGGGTPDASALQEITPNYEGMYQASPTGYNALQAKRANSTELEGILPNYAGFAEAAPTLEANRTASPAANLMDALPGVASALAPGQDQVGNMFRAQAGSAPTGLLDFYQNNMSQQFQPVQSKQGLMTMPTYNFAGVK